MLVLRFLVHLVWIGLQNTGAFIGVIVLGIPYMLLVHWWIVPLLEYYEKWKLANDPPTAMRHAMKINEEQEP